MSDIIDLKKFLRGFVRVTNEAGLSVEAHNLVVYTGGDILAQLLAGNPQFRISHIYFGFENTAGVPTFAAPARSDTADFFAALSAPQDYLRAAVLAPVLLEAADGNHNYNRATFTAIAASAVGVNGVSFGAGFNSQVATLGLVAAPTGVVGGDVLYARVNLATPLPAAGSGQVTATWATEAN